MSINANSLTADQEPGRSRGRPASRPYDEDIDPALLTRRSRSEMGANELDIPAELLDPEWDYQWFTTTVMNQPVDPSDLVDAASQGWRPVAARGRWFERMCPAGYEGRTIDRRGQRLYCRPMRLTIEARKEADENARELKRNRLEQALATPEGTAPRGGLVQLETGLPERIPSETLDKRAVSL